MSRWMNPLRQVLAVVVAGFLGCSFIAGTPGCSKTTPETVKPEVLRGTFWHGQNAGHEVWLSFDKAENNFRYHIVREGKSRSGQGDMLLEAGVLKGLNLWIGNGTVVSSERIDLNLALTPGEGHKVGVTPSTSEAWETVMARESSALRDQLSEDFPDDLPLFPRSAVVTQPDQPSGLRLAVLRSAAPFEEIRDFYESQLPKQGWKISETAEIEHRDGGVKFQAEKGTSRADIEIEKDQRAREVSIVINVFARK